MAVRVKIKIDSTGGKSLKTVHFVHRRLRLTVALVNTGFETPRPQFLLPIKAAEKLSLWPNLPTEAKVEIYDTAGGPMRVYIVPDSAWVSILAEERDSEKILSDMVISHTEVEVLISDKLAGKLKVFASLTDDFVLRAIEDAGEGIWRFRDDSPDKKRMSESPEYWT